VMAYGNCIRLTATASLRDKPKRCRATALQITAISPAASDPGAKKFATDGSIYIIPIDVVSRTVRQNAQHSDTLTGGLLQQRFIHRRYGTSRGSTHWKSEIFLFLGSIWKA
jgi:hypothetical protein